MYILRRKLALDSSLRGNDAQFLGLSENACTAAAFPYKLGEAGAAGFGASGTLDLTMSSSGRWLAIRYAS